MFQRNSYARLYIKDLSTLEETSFPVDISTNEIDAVTMPTIHTDKEYIEFCAWIYLTPSDILNTYILTTTSNLSDKIERFEINMEDKTVLKIE